jgi:hypothetical protein
MSTYDQHKGVIEASLASKRLVQRCKPQFATPRLLPIIRDDTVSMRSTFVMSA